MRKRSFHRKSGARNQQRTFWVRNTGTLTAATAALPAFITLFDPLAFAPDPTTARAEINRSFTMLACVFNFTATFFGVVTTGTAGDVDIYMGLSKDDRRAVVAMSPSFSSGDDARADWLNVWMDFAAGGNTGGPKSVVTQQTLGMANTEHQCQRVVRVKRRFESEDVLNFSTVFFGHAGGTMTGSYSLDVSWQLAVLLREG